MQQQMVPMNPMPQQQDPNQQLQPSDSLEKRSPASPKNDAIIKVKTLASQLNDSLLDTFKTAGLNLQQNVPPDSNVSTEPSHKRFDESAEKFFSICDLLELNLRQMIGKKQQYAAVSRHNPAGLPNNQDMSKYGQYTANVKQQVTSAAELKATLEQVLIPAQQFTPSRPPQQPNSS